jgi:hypothetical protein
MNTNHDHNPRGKTIAFFGRGGSGESTVAAEIVHGLEEAGRRRRAGRTPRNERIG